MKTLVTVSSLLALSITAGTADAAKAIPMKTIRRAAATLSRIVDRTPQEASGWKSVDLLELKRVAREQKLSPAGKRALSTAYLAAYPGSSEFRIDPSRKAIKNALSNAVIRLAKADQAKNNNKLVSTTEAKATKFWTPRNLYSYARELAAK